MPKENTANIRPIALQQVAVISLLAARIWPVSFAGILTAAQIANMLERIYSEENLREEMNKGHRFWVAYNDDAPLGFVSAYKEDETIWLKKLYILPQEQGKGIGSALMNTATTSFLPAAKQNLLVNRDNIAAQRYYVHKGFTRIGESPAQMGNYRFIDFIYSRTL